MPTVLVFCEVQDNKLKKASREALSIGRKLAEAAGGDLAAFAADRAAADDAGRYGAKTLYVTSAGGYNTETYTSAMQAAVKLTWLMPTHGWSAGRAFSRRARQRR